MADFQTHFKNLRRTNIENSNCSLTFVDLLLNYKIIESNNFLYPMYPY